MAVVERFIPDNLVTLQEKLAMYKEALTALEERFAEGNMVAEVHKQLSEHGACFYVRASIFHHWDNRTRGGVEICCGYRDSQED